MDELKFFKKSLEFSEARFEAVAQTATDSIVISDENSLIVFANKKTYEIFGYKERELIGLSLELLMPEKYRKAHSAGMQRFIHSGVPKLIGHTIEIEGIRKDGSVFPLELSLSSWQEEKNYFFSGIIRDITKRKEQEKSLQDTNQELAATLEELQSAEEQLKETNEELERKVEERTARLEEQKSGLQNLFMQVPALIGILRGREGRVELFNATFSKLWGNRPVMGKTIREAWPELEGQEYFEFVESVYDTGEAVVRSEFPGYIDRYNTGTTELAYFDFIFAPYIDLDGKVDGVIIYGVEVTEHVLARSKLKELNEALADKNKELAASEEEIRQTLDKTLELNEALAERENFLSSIIDQTPVSTWIANPEGTLIQANEACMNLFGVKDASMGVGKYNILKDELLKDQPFYKDIQAVFTEGKVIKFSGWYNLSKVKHVNIPFSKKLYLVATVFPIKNAQGEVTHAVIQHEDITEKMVSEQALRKSEEQLRLITDALPVLISYVNAEHIYTFVNKAYTTWFGKSKEDILGKPAWEIIGETAFESVKEEVLKVLSGEEVRFEGHMPYRFGGTRDTISHLVPHKVDDKVVGYFVLVTDVSSLRKAQAELIQKNRELIRINTDLDNFIYTASHDLKSPIVNMEGLLTMMGQSLKEKLNEKEQKSLAMMEVSIEKLKNTISSLSDVTKVAKNLDQQKEKILIREVIEDVKSDIHHLIQETDPTFIEEYEVEQIEIAKANFRSIAYNLLSNAIKYRSPDRPLQINISTYKEGKFFAFSVQDNGLGLSATQQSKLFIMFKRLHTHVEGTGIGLYIIKRIVENMQGKVIVESEPNQGSTFTVYFPKLQHPPLYP